MVQTRALIIVGLGWVALFALMLSFHSCGNAPNQSFPQFPESSEGYTADEPEPERSDNPDCKCYCLPGESREDWGDTHSPDSLADSQE